MSFNRFGKRFPFDDADCDFRSRLQDIAQRYPEFAQDLNPDTWSRRRTGSHSGVTDDPFAGLRQRSRLPHFADFPFDDEFGDPRSFERYYQHPADSAASQPQSQASRPPPSQPPPGAAKPGEARPAASDSQASSSANRPPTKQPKGAHIQQSNTVDLGQPQEPLVDETRTQRSMSAPPDHRNAPAGKRYVSSINIPNVNADMGGTMSQQPTAGTDHAAPPPPMGGNNPKERIIPIHIEGRDEPVMPKAGHTHQPQPQPEKLFGQKPSTFSQFVHPQQPPYDQAQATDEDMRQQAEMRRQQQQQKFQEFQKQQQQQQQQAPQQQQPPQQPQPPPAKPTSLELIQNIQRDVSDLMTQVEKFEGKPRDKQYLYLDEMLTRKMLLLDDIETGGQDVIRKARKEAIKCIQDTLKILETKAQNNEEGAKAREAEPKQESMEVESATAPAAAESGLVVGGVVRSGTQNAMEVEAPEESTTSKGTEAAGDVPKCIQTDMPVQADDATSTQGLNTNAEQHPEAVATADADVQTAASQEKQTEDVANGTPTGSNQEEPKESGNEKKKVKKKADKK